MLKSLLSNKEKLLELANTPLNENCSAVILKKLPEKLGDPGNFLIPCGFSKLKCKALADLSPLILRRPFLRTARALIDVHGEEMILRDSDERLTLNMRHDTSSYSNQPQKESINMINIFNDLSEDFLENLFDPEVGNVLPEKLLDLNSTKDLHPPYNVNPLSGSTTSSSSPNHLLEEFADEFALITFPLGNDDLPFHIDTTSSSSSPNHLLEEFADEFALITFPLGNDDLPFHIEFDLKEIEYLLNQDPIKEMDSILKDSIDQSNLADLNDNLIDTMPEMFTEEHALDYSSPPLYDEYDDDLFKLSPTLNIDFILSPEYDLFLSEDFFEVDALPSTNNEDKVFNPGILIREKLCEVITRVALEKNDKNPAISHAFSILEDSNPLIYKLPFFKEVPRLGKIFKPGILTSKEVHSSFIPKLSHQGYKVFKINQILKIPMKIFLFSRGEDIHILDVPCLHFYPP
nr:reverse transcriptase domain-containing protein [Tanacetum cinerariifolium]